MIETSENLPKAKRSAHFLADDSVEITIAPNGGACFGVVRAIKLGQVAVDKSVGKNRAVYSFGPLVHNPMTIEHFEKQGVKIVEDPASVNAGTVILRSHGVKQEIEADLKSRGIGIVDATCPLVKKPQRIASAIGSRGQYLVLVGDSKHPEVKGVLSYYGRPEYLVTYHPADVAKIPDTVSKVGIVAQTTIEVGVFDSIVEECRKRFKEVAVYNTICDATSIRQTEAEALAKEADVFIVVGGKNSSNTNKLVKICKTYQLETHLVENKEEIQLEWFSGKKKIALTGGASTPQDYVDEVGDYIATLLHPTSN